MVWILDAPRARTLAVHVSDRDMEVSEILTTVGRIMTAKTMIVAKRDSPGP